MNFKSDSYRTFQGYTLLYKTDQDASVRSLTSSVPFLPPFVHGTPTTYFQGEVPHEQATAIVSASENDVHPFDPWTISHPPQDTGVVVPIVRICCTTCSTACLLDTPGQQYISDSNASISVDLATGDFGTNLAVFRVRASDLTTYKEYTIDIKRPADVEAHVANMTYSIGEPTQTGSGRVGFSTSVFDYNSTVIFEVDQVVVTVKAVDPDVGSIWVGMRGTTGHIVHSPAGGLFVSPPVPIENGKESALDVVVFAEDGVHTLVYTNHITRPQYSRSQFARQFLTGEWRRSQHGESMILTMGGHWNPCSVPGRDGQDWVMQDSPFYPKIESAEDKKRREAAMQPVPFAECRENSFELIQTDGSVQHELRGWYEVNTYSEPNVFSLDVLEGTGVYKSLIGARLQGWYRLTDWPVPTTDGLSTATRTHVNIELDLGWCASLEGRMCGNSTCIADTSINTGSEDIVGFENLVAPESVGPWGRIPFSCPPLAHVLGNDTSHFYLQMLRDVDECKDNTHGCSTDAICTNTYGSRWCACRSGYEGNPYFDTCHDINECERQIHSCGHQSFCINTPGAFNCSCNHGYEGNPSVYTFDVDVTPDGSIDMMKRPGLEWECVSVHENHTCQHVPTVYPQRDTSRRGGRRDAHLDPSRGPSRLGKDDEEQLWHFDDPPNAEYAADSMHYYREKTDPEYIRALTESVPYPPPRWHFDGTPAADDECSDIDECATEAHGCGDNSYCFNVPGSFSCHCHIGYRGDAYSSGEWEQCIDIDECVEETHSCSDNSLCINVPGSYVCKCPAEENHKGQLFWHDRAPGKPYNSRCHMPLRQSRAFVTYERWTGEQVGTLNGADAKCHSEGPELQPGFRWKAVLSDHGTSAVHHLTAGETNILYPVIRTDGELVAVDADQLWTGLRLEEGTVRGVKRYFGLSNPINIDGSGRAIPDEPEWTGAHQVWTGSDLNGNRFPHGSCWSWREQLPFAQNQFGGNEPSSETGAGHLGGSSFAGHHAGTVDARTPMYAGDVWNYDGPVNSSWSFSKPATHLPAGVGGSYGDLRSTLTQWHTGRDTLRECETKRRRLFCMEVHYATRSVLRDTRISPYGSHLNSSWFSASASTVVSSKDVYPFHGIDGANATFWQASLSDSDAWFQVDMQAHFTVTAVLVQWRASCFPAAYSLMLSNSPVPNPDPPTSKFAAWQDPSWQQNSTAYLGDPDWRIFHEIISRTMRGGDQRLEQPSLLSRAMVNRQLVKDPQFSTTAVSPPEVARHVRIMVTDANDMLCHALTEVAIFSPEERPFGSYSESARRASFRGLRGDGTEQSHNGNFPRSSNPSVADSSVDGAHGYMDRDAWPTPSDGSVAYTSGTHRHLLEQPAGFPQVTSHAPPGWEFLQQRNRVRATQRQRETRFDNMRHRYTQADSKLHPANRDHPQWPCPPGVMSCDSFEPSSQEGHARADEPRPNMPTPVNYATPGPSERSAGKPVRRRQLTQPQIPVVGCESREGCASSAPAPPGSSRDQGNGTSSDTEHRYLRRVTIGGPSEGYRPRGSQDGDLPPSSSSHDERISRAAPPGTRQPSGADINESPLRRHNPFRGTVLEFDLRADTTQVQEPVGYPGGGHAGQPMHDSQRKASFPEMHGPQWKPGGPV